MPYIKADDGRRKALQKEDTALLAGELNYQIFYLVKHFSSEGNLRYIIECSVEKFLGEKRNYQKYNDMTGALVQCYVEIKRRLNIDADYLLDIVASYKDEIAKYEDLKITENGDVE